MVLNVAVSFELLNRPKLADSTFNNLMMYLITNLFKNEHKSVYPADAYRCSFFLISFPLNVTNCLKRYKAIFS
jgi:hypothetical protein